MKETMNTAQFSIVKVMQKCGIKARDFARACHASEKMMNIAYTAHNHQQFVEMWEEGRDPLGPFGPFTGAFK